MSEPQQRQPQQRRQQQQQAPGLDALVDALRRFASARDWEQFHSPKNLAAALCVEAAELLEPFQWLTEQQSRALPDATREAVAGEMADVLLYLLQLADQLGVDLVQAAERKMAINEVRYPVERARGSAKKAGGDGEP
jgi:NTP pyrophosphatase (non-canonical NTP hydrolase)